MNTYLSRKNSIIATASDSIDHKTLYTETSYIRHISYKEIACRRLRIESLECQVLIRTCSCPANVTQGDGYYGLSNQEIRLQTVAFFCKLSVLDHDLQ